MAGTQNTTNNIFDNGFGPCFKVSPVGVTYEQIEGIVSKIVNAKHLKEVMYYIMSAVENYNHEFTAANIESIKGIGPSTVKKIMDNVSNMLKEHAMKTQKSIDESMGKIDTPHEMSDEELEALAMGQDGENDQTTTTQNTTVASPGNEVMRRMAGGQSTSNTSSNKHVVHNYDRGSIAAVRLFGLGLKLVIPCSHGWHPTMGTFVNQYVLGGEYGLKGAVKMSEMLFQLADITAKQLGEIFEYVDGDVVFSDSHSPSKEVKIMFEPDYYLANKDLLRKFCQVIKVLALARNKVLKIEATEDYGLVLSWPANGFEDAASRFTLPIDQQRKPQYTQRQGQQARR